VGPPHGCACPHNFRVDLTCAICDAWRAAPGTQAGLGRDVVRHVVAGARGAPARAHHAWDDGVDGGPRL